VLKRVHQLVCQMLSKCDDYRPALPDVISEIEKIQQSYNELELTVGLVDLAELARLSNDEKKEFINKIEANCYEVVLTAEDNTCIDMDAVKFVRELQNLGLRVYEKIFHGSTAKIAAEFSCLEPHMPRTVRSIPISGLVVNEYDELTEIRNIVKGKVSQLCQFFTSGRCEQERLPTYYDGPLPVLFQSSKQRSCANNFSYDDEIESKSSIHSYDDDLESEGSKHSYD